MYTTVNGHNTFCYTGGKPFDAEINPVRIDWLPDFANRWFNRNWHGLKRTSPA